jgi:hypothetical protein
MRKETKWLKNISKSSQNYLDKWRTTRKKVF